MSQVYFHQNIGQYSQTGATQEQAVKQYAIVIEHQPGSNYSAYVPDLPGCVSTGDSLEEVQQNIKEAIAFHLRGLREDGEPIPEPITRVAYAEVA